VVGTDMSMVNTILSEDHVRCGKNIGNRCLQAGGICVVEDATGSACLDDSYVLGS